MTQINFSRKQIIKVTIKLRRFASNGAEPEWHHFAVKTAPQVGLNEWLDLSAFWKYQYWNADMAGHFLRMARH